MEDFTKERIEARELEALRARLHDMTQTWTMDDEIRWRELNESKED